MSSRFLSLCLFGALLSAGLTAAAQPLRFCADPNNLPFSDRSGQGFDNRIAVLLARDLHREPVFVWTRSRRGFLREQFNRNACDLLMGAPSGMKALANSRPYYRSSYVFVTRTREHLQIASFSNPKLDGRRIGLQIMEEDLSPPSLPLIRSGHAAQLVGYETFGSGAGNLVRAVSSDRLDLAVVWGPVAGFYVAAQHLPLTLAPVSPAVDSGIPFVFSITVGVHKKDLTLRDAVDASLLRLQPRIDRILAASHVPTLPLDGGAL